MLEAVDNSKFLIKHIDNIDEYDYKMVIHSKERRTLKKDDIISIGYVVLTMM
jgi:hypothetical protein